MTWEEISKRIDNEIEIGSRIPKTDGGYRMITGKVGPKIYIQVGIETEVKKCVTKEMLRYAYENLNSGKPFTSSGLKSNFPDEYSQGGCVFSMTGGIFESLGIAKYRRGIGYILL